MFPLLPETANVYLEWRRLVIAHQIVGKNAHDLRIVAAMIVHGLSQILTFNTGHFTRFPAVTALDPAAVVSPSTP